MEENRQPASATVHPAQQTEEEKKGSQNDNSREEELLNNAIGGPGGDNQSFNNPEYHSQYDNYSARNFN